MKCHIIKYVDMERNLIYEREIFIPTEEKPHQNGLMFFVFSPAAVPFSTTCMHTRPTGGGTGQVLACAVGSCARLLKYSVFLIYGAYI
jgi:hypothetical protein